MAVAVTGSTYTSTGGGTGNNTITSVTVPADANCAIACAGGYYNGTTANFDVLNFQSDGSLDFTQINQAGTANIESCFAWYLLSTHADWPGSGSGRTLQFSYNVSLSDGPICVLFFLSGVDTASPVIGSQVQEATSQSVWTSPSVGTVGANDMGFVVGYQYTAAVNADPTGYGQTAIYEGGAGYRIGVGYEAGEDELRVEATGGVYLGAVAFAIRASTGGASAVPANRGNVGMMLGMSNAMWLDNDFLKPTGGN